MTGLIALAAGVIYIIYMVSSTGGSLSEVVGFVMAMGNTYGMYLPMYVFTMHYTLCTNTLTH
jgi:hypothetical protein